MRQISKRIPLVLSALLTLVFAVWGGLLRLQWQLPVPQANWISFHGPLMVSGFFGTIIGLARASALRSKTGLIVPLATVAGAWTLLLGGPENWGALLFLAASLGYLLVSIGFFGKQPAYAAALALGGGAGWAWGNLFWWRGEPIPHVMAGWQILFVLTIASERLEAIRWRPSGWRGALLLVDVALLMTGVVLQPFEPAIGVRVAGAGFLLLAFCLLIFEKEWIGQGTEGWKTYTKTCLVSSYVWLFLGGLVGSIAAPVDSGFAYDALLHCIFLGLVFSMVFSHAPLLLPRVLKTPVPFHRFFYSHWFLLQASLALRVGGDIAGSTPLRRWGALWNALALLFFILNTFWAVREGRRRRG
ncbi:MAG TPA: hypothetical protein VHE12_03305 [bacterium]|nr:hypothetical protein [bacterium]